jgi:hypothetical protein
MPKAEQNLSPILSEDRPARAEQESSPKIVSAGRVASAEPEDPGRGDWRGLADRDDSGPEQPGTRLPADRPGPPQDAGLAAGLQEAGREGIQGLIDFIMFKKGRHPLERD